MPYEVQLCLIVESLLPAEAKALEVQLASLIHRSVRESVHVTEAMSSVSWVNDEGGNIDAGDGGQWPTDRQSESMNIIAAREGREWDDFEAAPDYDEPGKG